MLLKVEYYTTCSADMWHIILLAMLIRCAEIMPEFSNYAPDLNSEIMLKSGVDSAYIGATKLERILNLFSPSSTPIRKYWFLMPRRDLKLLSKPKEHATR